MWWSSSRIAGLCTEPRSVAATAAVLVACAGGGAQPDTRDDASNAPAVSASEVATSELAPSATGHSRDEPNRPIFEASARLRPDAPQTSASAEALAAGELTMESCEPKKPPAGYQDCEAVEVIGGPPCELECWRERKVATKAADSCCEAPMHGAIFGKSGLLVEADACAHVAPSCAHTSNPIKSSEMGFHFFSDSAPREVLLVQGGCEMRAMGHGYVPSGVAAWTGCAVAQRFRWNGARFILVP